MSKDQADQSPTAGAVPLLRTLGDANAAVCIDGFCEVPQPRETTPGDDGSHE